MNPKTKNLKLWAIISSAVLTKTLVIVTFYWLGKKADAAWGTAPYGMGLGIFLGFILGFAWLAYVLKRAE